jgi:hypothetical protein
MPIKTFRGLIADGGQDTIVLHTNTGSTGYRIVRFEMFHTQPGEQHAEHTIKIFSVQQTAVSNDIDFSDQTLLGAGYLLENADNAYPVSTRVIFDKMVFNQDIYLTHEDTVGSLGCNYYIELEQVKLDLNENTVATLKNLRNES